MTTAVFWAVFCLLWPFPKRATASLIRTILIIALRFLLLVINGYAQTLSIW
jgi:hypothetical protein